MSISEELSDAVAQAPKSVPLTPHKKATGAKAGKYQPRLGNIQMGVNVRKLTPTVVMVSPEMSAGTHDEQTAHWDLVLKALLDSGYTLIANVLSKETRIVGGPEALARAKETQIVAVTKRA